MKFKLTLCLDDDLKERAKRLADERGTSISKLVEDYLRLLLESSSEEGASAAGSSSISESPSQARLSPRVLRLKERLGRPAPSVTMDADTRRWIEATAEKHV